MATARIQAQDVLIEIEVPESLASFLVTWAEHDRRSHEYCLAILVSLGLTHMAILNEEDDGFLKKVAPVIREIAELAPKEGAFAAASDGDHKRCDSCGRYL